MPITHTQLFAAASSSPSFGTGNYTTSSLAVTAGDLLIARTATTSLGNNGLNGSSLQISDSGSNSWTSIAATTTSPGWSYGARAWRAIAAATGNITISVGTGGAFSVVGYGLVVDKMTGYNAAAPAFGPIVGSDADGDGAASLTLGSAAVSEDYVFAAVNRILTGAAGTVNAGSGWTEELEVPVFDWHCLQFQRRTGFTGTAVDWSDLSVGSTGVGAAMLAFGVRAAVASPARRLTLANGKYLTDATGKALVI